MDSVLKISELLYERSLEATQSVGELLLSVKKAKAACSIFTDTCLSHENWPDLKIFLSHQSNMLNEQEPNSQMLVSVSSLLKEDGTFHCRLIDNFTYNEKLLNDISNKLWWEIKDSTAKCIQPVPLNCPIFHFSTTYNMYVRGVVVSCHESQQNKYSVSYLDFGCTLNVNAETQFFLLPNEFQNQLKYPYQSLHCTLFDSSIKVSNVVQQKFSELTTNRVLKIEIKCTVTIANTSYLLVELRTIPDNLIVNYEITKIVKENVDEMVQNEEEIKPLSSVSNSEVMLPIIPNLKNDEQNNNKSVQRPVDLETLNDSFICPATNNLEYNKLNNTVLSEQSIYYTSHSTSSKMSNSLSDLKSVDIEKKETTSVPIVSSTTTVINKQTNNIITNKPATLSEDNKGDSIASKLVPLQNLLYNSITPRSNSWTEIELLNISKLLKSQALIQFFICTMPLLKIMHSLKTRKLYLKRSIFQSVKKSTTVYIILKVNEQDFKNFYVGIAKPNLNKSSRDGYDVVYLCLSCVSVIKSSHNVDNFLSINLMEAKAIVLHYEACLKKKTSIPLFNHIYPWCGDVFEGKTQNGILTEQSLNTKTKSYENLSLQTEHSQRLNSKPNFVIDQKLFRRCLKENIEFNDSMQHNGLHAGSSNQIGFDSFCETVTVEDMVNSGCNEEFFPRAILQRPPTIGYYDPYGTWFPETPIANMYINSNEVLNESHNSLSFKSNIENDITNNHITNVNFSDCSREINQDVRISNCGDLQNNMENTSCGNTSDNVEKELEKLLSSSDENH
ncbi:uncharacterized protein LOC136071818 isoform X1 [Hydra vulgaris]|uniref:Uncharacterized protein LOC136071818 isoform X1 n=1 Tax=Hydra vulgaris TaxID=6087 RepID=A0ABM4BVR9_HYDVU